MLTILVPIKRVIDYRVAIRLKPDQSGVVTDNVKMSINPFDAIALEEAIRLKEKSEVDQVITVTIGAKIAEDILKQALAMGADKAILIESGQSLVPLQTAEILKQVVTEEEAYMVFMGKQAIDDDNNQSGQILAAKLGWAQATFASKITLDKDRATVVREVDGGLETLQVKLPAVITSDLRLNEPRLPRLPDIMKAKNKPLEVRSIGQYTFSNDTGFDIVSVTPPPARQAGVMVESVAELMNKLKNEAKVIT